MNKTLLLSFLSIIRVLSLATANAEETTYRHWPFDELIDSGAATPDASPHQTHAQL